jgi:hypothetical protein
MAIVPATRYPGQVDAGIPEYPHGRARNRLSPSSGDGTPWEQDLVNDFFGLLQGLLVDAEITPSGLVDNATLSQYRTALRKLTRRCACTVAVSGTGLDAGDHFDLAIATETTTNPEVPDFADPGFAVVDDGIGNDVLRVPEPGVYLVTQAISVIGSSGAAVLRVQTRAGGVVDSMRARGSRYSTNVAEPVEVVGSRLLTFIDAEGGRDLALTVHSLTGGEIAVQSFSTLTAVKISGGNVATGW